MKKIISVFLLVIVIVVVGAGLVFFNKDAAVFDIFFSKEQREERILNRMAGLYPEEVGDFKLYSFHSTGAGKITKDKEECQEVNETINREEGNIEISGTICVRSTIGQYRNNKNEAIFVHLLKITKGADIEGLDYLLGKTPKTSDKLDGYNVFRPENHEIGWFPMDSSKITVVLTQEGLAKANPDGDESMSYPNKAIGENSVTQYFISNFPSN